MNDFFATGNSLDTDNDMLSDMFASIYGWKPGANCFLGVNLQWPKFDLPQNANKYFLSWHTEQFDLHWLRQQTEKIYPRPVLVAYDGQVDSTVFPDNVKFVRWLTWHNQLALLNDRFGMCESPQLPKYKLSSLSFRVSQYKKFVTAFLLKHAQSKDMILTYHNVVGKQQDLHGHPRGLAWLDELDMNLAPTFINFNDAYSWNKNQPVNNGGWHNPAYEQALVNLTNESFHYSLSQIDNQNFLYPGPYLTEKTWKPLLAGRPFLAVSQWNTYKELQQLGLRCDFGFPIDFDSDPGDLSRVNGIFQAIDHVLNTPILDLFDQSIQSVQHNTAMIKQGVFAELCNATNNQSKQKIMDFTNS